MSTSRGRSWRPEKRISKKDSRRVLVYLTATVLTGLVGTVLFLLIGPGVPLLHFVVVTEHSFHTDDTTLTPLPTGATALNAVRLTELFESCRELNQQQIGEGSTYDSLDELINANTLLAGRRLFIYCAADAWCVLDKENSEDCVLELLPANISKQRSPVRFSKLLSNLKKGGCPQILLMLEFTGRTPGLASGAIVDDIATQIRREIQLAKVPGLTVICSHEHGERSWEYVPDSAEATTTDNKASIMPTPAFRGTAFGHFLDQALTEGKAGTATELLETLQTNVTDWVQRQFGERQSVWMVSTSTADAGKQLLALARLPEAESQVPAVADAGVDTSKESASKAEGEKKDDLTATKAEVPDDRPIARLSRLLARRDELRDHTVTPVLYPAEWLRLHTNLVAAERFVLNGNDPEFFSIHDDILQKLKELQKKTDESSMSPKLQDVDDWIATESSEPISEDDARLLKRTQYDFSVEANKAPSSLPDQITERRALRRVFVSQLSRDLKQLAKSIADETPEAQARLIQERSFLLQNLSSRWSGNVIPDEWTTVNEVLRGEDTKWHAAVMKSLVRLLDLRHETLRFAAGKDTDGKLLRQNDWKRISEDINTLLTTLYAAERWLCVGPEGKLLADDRLDSAEQILRSIKDKVVRGTRLNRIQDEQRFQIPFLVQYLAFRLEEISLTDKEITAAKLMASKAVDGNVTAADFPVGQLNPLELNREHIEAAFALTRDFTRPQSEVTDSDERHVVALERFVKERISNPIPASETWELLNTPLIANRENQYLGLIKGSVSITRQPLDSGGGSGVWTSFWSLRLVDAIAQKSIPSDWQKWQDLVASVADAEKKSDVLIKRAAMAEILRQRWIDAIQGLKQFQNSDVFAPENERLQLLTNDLTRRIRNASADNRSLYSRIQETLPVQPTRTEAASITILNPNVELTSDYSATTNLRVSQAAQLYVLNNDNDVTLRNTARQADRNWLRLPLSNNAESEVALDVGLRNAPQIPTPLLIVAVDDTGTPIQQVTTTLQPPAEHTWEISVAQVEEGNPEVRPITLEEIDSRTNRRLRLLPSTLDPVTQMDVPTQLKLKLHRVKGISKSIRIKAFLSDGKTEAWRLPEPLLIPDGSSIVDIPFSLPVAEGAATAGAASVIEISKGLIFEITPDDLPRKITSQFRLTPRLLGPADILKRPNPKYEESDELLITLNRVPFDNSNVLWPKKLTAELELSPKLQRYLRPGTNLKTLDADGFTFRVPFNSDIRKVLSEDELEFGLSVGGIPHGWWWTLTNGTVRLLEGNQPQIRTFLSIDNPIEIQPVSETPNLLLGKGWEKAKMTARVFIHGGTFDRDWSMRMFFLRQDAATSIRATDAPFNVQGRFVENVRISSGEKGTWLFSTTTNPYRVSAFSQATFGFQNGTYVLNTTLEQRGSNEDPISSTVAFTFDDTPPEINADNVQLSQQKTHVNKSLQGRVRTTDRESGIKAIRIGLNPEMMESLPITSGKEIDRPFEVDSSKGFPKIEQKEQDEFTTGTLIVEVDNFAGGTSTVKKPVTFFSPGKAAAPMAKIPGTIVVKFKNASPFNVTVSGNGVAKDAPNSVGIATIPDLPPGTYAVTWKPAQGTAGDGQESVFVGSGKTVTVGPGK